MKKKLRGTLTAALICAALAQTTLAETVTFNGTVTASDTYEVYAPIGGMVDSVCAEVGETVSADDALVKLKTTKIYAAQSGTVTGIFGEPGDSAETVAERYGAVLYIEGANVYTVSASTENAYSSTETKTVHVGETVYLKCRSDASHTGTGRITSISGIDYTVEVLSGDFILDESVDVYRSDSCKSSTRVGRGTIERRSPAAVTAAGSIVSFAVSDGDAVEKGDLLFETLNGTFDGLYMSGGDILAGINGTVASISAQQGGAVEKDAVVAVLYPADAMRVEALIPESDLGEISVGDPVSIELTWNQDDEVIYPGTVSMISGIASETASDGGSTVNYKVLIDFTPDENTRYGMSAVITAGDEPAPEEAEDVQE